MKAFLLLCVCWNAPTFAGERDYLEWAGINDAQKITKGEGVLIAVLNSGVNYRLPEFSGRIAREQNGSYGFDAVLGMHDPDDKLDIGLGTQVSSIIAGNQWGIAPEALLVPVRIFDENGAGTMEGIARGLNYAVDRGVKLIALSGGPLNLERDGQAVCEALQRAEQNDILILLSAGNSGAYLGAYPTGCELHLVVNVAAVDSKGDLATYSNFGYPAIHLAAPAENIWRISRDGSTRTDGQGTSYSLAVAAGVAALVRSAHPEFKAMDVKNALIRGSVERESLRGKVYSNGYLHAAKALGVKAPR